MLCGLRLSGLATRFIPTWVGNASIWRCMAHSHTVHPHVGGECNPPTFVNAGHAGSSPRGWGMPCQLHDHPLPFRFIPTWVGNADEARAWLRDNPVHPHVGGECVDQGHLWSITDGSSPRGWGMPQSNILTPNHFRFIPTWVGNAAGPSKETRSRTVHPHVGGECAIAHCSGSSSAGSSPRGWGMLVVL